MTAAVYDFAAIAKLTKAFAEEPPQNEVKPQPEKPAYSYSSGDLGEQQDYGMYAGFINPDDADTAPCEYLAADFDPA